MAHKIFEVNTIEELVKLVDENPRYVDTKWVLNEGVDGGLVLDAKRKSWNSSTTLVLAQEVGRAIDSIWPRKAPYEGATYEVRTTNGLTLKGVLKRLEQSDVKATIANAKEELETERRKNERNAMRRRVSALAKEIKKLEGEIARIKSENPHINWPDSLEEMINIELEA